MSEYFHTPAFLNSILDYLDIKPSDKVLDCTCGEGGHSSLILKKISKEGFLVSIDKDSEILKIAKKRLSQISSNFLLLHLSFSSADKALKLSGLKSFDKVLIDLGLSMYHIAKSERGFSFFSEAKCDMRYNRFQNGIDASFVLNNYSEEEISDIIYKYGEEKMARRIAHAIVSERKKKPIESCKDLTEIIAKVYKYKGRLNPATRAFQALRIYVNSELTELNNFLSILPSIVSQSGLVGIISYHSLEDRIVKNFFKSSNEFKPLNKKVIIPDYEEIKINKAIRSAKLRIGVRS
jgi:16S rRNA (cytosine1402-N4)-methyltransferase